MSISNSYGTVEMAYNSRIFVTSRTDGEGYTTRKFYDRMGNLTAYYPPVQWEKKEGAMSTAAISWRGWWTPYPPCRSTRGYSGILTGR